MPEETKLPEEGLSQRIRQTEMKTTREASAQLQFRHSSTCLAAQVSSRPMVVPGFGIGRKRLLNQSVFGSKW